MSIDDDNDTQSTEDKKPRQGARARAFNDMYRVLAEHRISWNKDITLATSSPEEKLEAEHVVEYIDYLFESLEEVENPPEVEKEKKPRVAKGPGPLTRRRFWLVLDKNGNRVYHYCVNPRTIENAAKVFGPMTTEAGAVYRVSIGFDGLEEYDMSGGDSIRD